MLIILLVNCQVFLIEAVVGGDLGNLARIVVLELVDIPNHLAFVSTDSS